MQRGRGKDGGSERPRDAAPRQPDVVYPLRDIRRVLRFDRVCSKDSAVQAVRYEQLGKLASHSVASVRA